MQKLRVLVVEDSLTVRRRVVDVLGADPEIEIVGEAEDGERAVELCRELRPDIVTLDLVLPVMTGLAATEHIMAHFPTPILIVSSSINRGELFRTYDALAAGAVDVLEKPTGEEADGVWEQRFIFAVKMVARIKVITHPRARLALRARRTGTSDIAPIMSSEQSRTLVAIGASTGGPSAVVDVLRAIPEGYPIPILLVLHIGESFGVAFADWLDAQTCHRVSFARDGERLESAGGRVVMAPPNKHLIVRDHALWLTSSPERHSCRPSVDVLFESIAAAVGRESAAFLLTGMGRDGAAGLLEIRRRGGLTVAQDEATSVVYGMPREAALLGAAQRVLPLVEIGPAIAALAPKSREP